MTTLTDFRFSAHQLSSKPGPKGKTLTYVDVRVIAGVLDDLTPGWSSTVTLTHNGTEYAAVCQLIVDGITRADVGSGETPPDASNQSFRRAAAAHGLGRYLWTGEPAPVAQPWQTWQTVDDMLDWALAEGTINAVEHGRNALRLVVEADLGGKLTKSNWRQACELFYHNRLRRTSEKATAKAVKANGHVPTVHAA